MLRRWEQRGAKSSQALALPCRIVLVRADESPDVEVADGWGGSDHGPL